MKQSGNVTTLKTGLRLKRSADGTYTDMPA